MERRNQTHPFRLLAPDAADTSRAKIAIKGSRMDGWKREFRAFFARRYRADSAKFRFHSVFSRVCDWRGGLLIIILEKGGSILAFLVESTIEERCDYSIWRNFDFFFFFNSILEEKIEFYSTYFFQVSSVEDGLCNYLVWSTKREKKGGWFWLKEREIIRKLNLEIFFIWSFIFEKIKFENFIFFVSFHICSRIWRGDGRKFCNHTARERLKKK